MKKKEIVNLNIGTREKAIEVGLKLISKSQYNLKSLCQWLDDDIVMANLIKRDVYTYRYASKRLRSLKDLALYVVGVDGILLDSVENNLNDDFDVVLKAVKSYGLAIKDASSRLKQNKKIVVAAIKQEPRALTYAAKEYRNNLKFINYAFSVSGPFIVEPDALDTFSKIDAHCSYNSNYYRLTNLEMYNLIDKYLSGKISGQEVLTLQNMLLENSRKQIHYPD